MSKLFSTLLREPVMGAVVLVVGATVGLLVAFGVHVTDIQREAIEGWVGALLGLGVLVRSQVTPAPKAAHVDTAKALLAAHVAAQQPTTNPAPAPVPAGGGADASAA